MRLKLRRIFQQKISKKEDSTMPNKKNNPLIGSYRDPALDIPPDKPAKDKTPAEPPKAATDPKAPAAEPGKPTEDKKPAELPKAATDPKAPAAEPGKPAEDKKPTEPPKATTDPKAPAAEPGKPAEDKKPAEPPKATTDPKAPAAEPGKPAEDKKPAEPPKAATDPKAPAAEPGKPAEDKKPTEPPKATTDPKAPAAEPGKPAEDKKPTEPPKATTDPKAPAVEPGKPAEDKKPAEPPKATTDPKAPAAEPGKPAEDKKPAEPPKRPDIRFVKLSQIVPLPGTYVKDTPRKDYSDLIADIKKNGLQKAIILRQGEKGEFQLVDGFHRCKALEQDGKLEVRADVYEMSLTDASNYRKGHRKDPTLAIPGKLIPLHPAEPEKPKAEPPSAAESSTDKTEGDIPEDFTLPITKKGQSEIITTLKVSEIHPFEGHPFYVKDDQDMKDLVDSVKKFGVLEPAVVIPRKAGGYEMVSGHRRRRACELAGIATMPVIVRELDRDEAIISMVDSNLKREKISPMEKARAYSMKLDAMKRKAGRRTKEETAQMEAEGKKPMRADEQLAQQTGESRSNIQKIVRLNHLTPELQEMVEDKKLPVHTAADLSYLKEEEQAAVADAIKKEDKVPSGTQAAELKKESQAGTLTAEKIEKTVAPTKKEVDPPLKVTLGEEDLRPYFPGKGVTIPDVKKGIFEALDLRKKAIERREAKMQAEGAAKKKPSAPVR